jgi:hypothetical protein
MPAVVVPSGQQASPGERHCNLSSERHLFVVAYYFFEGGLTRPTFILDRQRRVPTQGRIRNTPKALARKFQVIKLQVTNTTKLSPKPCAQD